MIASRSVFLILGALTIWLPALGAAAILALAIWPSFGAWSPRRRIVSLVLAAIALIVVLGLGRVGQIPVTCLASSTSSCHPDPILGTAYHVWGWIALALVPALLTITGLPDGLIRLGARRSAHG
jgi:hypothetical protein